jgi:non-heme chloroperoxidase
MTAPDSVPVVFIHGLWMHASSWSPWVDLFGEKGYSALAPGWPGDADTVEQTRENPAAMNNVGIADVTDHYAAIIRGLASPPIVIGHSFGGLIAERLLGMGVTRGCVALAPAQFKGILGLPLAQLESAFPVLSKPWLRTKTWAHTPDSYAKNFANGVPRAESDTLFKEYVIPAPCRPLFQAGLANFAPRSEARVDTSHARGPLLLLAGGVDRTVPAATVRAAYKIQRKNPAVTEFEVLEGRGHSFPADSGWRVVADKALAFLAKHGLAASS